MTHGSSWHLYKQQYVDKDFERLDLFVLLKERYGIESALYPGSFVHVTPSLVYPVTAYADTDKRAKQFFSDPWLIEFIEKNKRYEEKPVIRFHPNDYTDPLREDPRSFDLLISQYAGFVSRHYKRYLRAKGLLVVNNSHGDASMASIDRDYRFIGAISIQRGEYRLIEENLDIYFVPKKDLEISEQYLGQIQRGVGYRKTAWAYVFKFRGSST
jgi:hypothetical protein